MITREPVTDSIGPRFANTLFLAVYAAVIAVPVAIFLGVLSPCIATHHLTALPTLPR